MSVLQGIYWLQEISLSIICVGSLANGEVTIITTEGVLNPIHLRDSSFSFTSLF
jgi:hypothetical protein